MLVRLSCGQLGQCNLPDPDPHSIRHSTRRRISHWQDATGASEPFNRAIATDRGRAQRQGCVSLSFGGGCSCPPALYKSPMMLLPAGSHGSMAEGVTSFQGAPRPQTAHIAASEAREIPPGPYGHHSILIHSRELRFSPSYRYICTEGKPSVERLQKPS